MLNRSSSVSYTASFAERKASWKKLAFKERLQQPVDGGEYDPVFRAQHRDATRFTGVTRFGNGYQSGRLGHVAFSSERVRKSFEASGAVRIEVRYCRRSLVHGIVREN